MRERGAPLAHRGERRAAVVVVTAILRMRVAVLHSTSVHAHFSRPPLHSQLLASFAVAAVAAYAAERRRAAAAMEHLMRRAIVLAREAEAAGGARTAR